MFLALPGALALLQFVGPHPQVQAASAGRTLKVKLNYTGAGVVDEKHKIYVMLFDANPYTASTLIDATSQPAPSAPAPGVSHILAREDASAKDATVTFRQLAVSPVYATAFFDKAGTYNGHLDSVSGAPMGAYGNWPDRLEPIKIAEGKTVQITMAFGDTAKSP
jgi:hypothetical protein